MTETEIKAELFDLWYHNCNGRLTLRSDGKRDPNDRPCYACSRIIELQNMLKKKTGEKRNFDNLAEETFKKYEELYERLA